jgi:hypothetical protein
LKDFDIRLVPDYLEFSLEAWSFSQAVRSEFKEKMGTGI